MSESPPKVFVSYSHDSEAHKNWVLTLSTRLVKNGVDVILDQWDLSLGTDLPRFMETGLTSARRVLAICSSIYVQKANAGFGGVGYEKMILTAQLVEDVKSDRIVPVIRLNSIAPPLSPLPTFLGSRVYADFRNDLAYEIEFHKLLRHLHGKEVQPRPPIGPNPFDAEGNVVGQNLSFGPERYVSPTLSGTVTFDYFNNNGRFELGAGDMAFETAWSRASNSSIHVVSDPGNIRWVALALGANEIEEVLNGSQYDSSSRVRTPQVGEIVIWKNVSGYFLATKVEGLQSRSHGNPRDEITFSYVIAPNKSACFAIEG